MDVNEAEVTLRQLGSSIGTSQARVEVGTSGISPHNHAYLKLHSAIDPDRYAVISTPGDRWFELEVAGGYGAIEASELTPDSEARAILGRLLLMAAAYLDGRWAVKKSRLVGVPVLVLDTEAGEVKLRLSAKESIRKLFFREPARRNLPG
ncbi:MAG: hypothetical protein IT189_00010 [Microbacteriaceae bacterium]|nr:hypothetical protein [Microbacteriaceae bacterium]